MNRGLIEKSYRQSLGATLLFGLGLLLLEVLLAYVYPTFRDEIHDVILKMEIVRKFVAGLVGTQVADRMGPELLDALPWIHPLLLAVVWAHGITLGTRVPAGEIDRGTIDLLLGLPVSRWDLLTSEGIVLAVSGAAVIFMGVIGNIIGGAIAGSTVDLGKLAVVLLNLYILYLAVAGVTFLISSASNRRGRAVGGALSFVLASFLLDFLAEFWDPAQRLVFSSIMSYYEPLVIIREGSWPVADLLVLASVGGVAWTLGGVIFSRRDVRVL